MPEACMLVLDNSEYMRNGDFLPTRWEAQRDAALIVFDAKTQSNPQSSVGTMMMAGKSPQVLSTLARDAGKLLQSIHDTSIHGNSDLSTSINIAQLALKHRQDKAHTQRIVAFVGSPVATSEEELVALGKRLKKNNVALDIVNFGQGEDNEARLQKLIESVNSGENSHLVTIEAGTQLLSDVVISSPILTEGGGGAGPSGSGGQGGGGAFEFGVDPSMDPELAMALRMSLEEEQARQRAAAPPSAAPATAAEVPAAATTSSSTVTTTSATAPPQGTPAGGSMIPPNTDALTGGGASAMDESEDEMLRQALALSQGGAGDGASGIQDEDVEMGSGGAAAAGDDGAEEDEDEEMTEEEAIARAIEMSLQEEHGDQQQQGKQ